MLPRSAEIQPLFLRFVTLSWPPAAPGWPAWAAEGWQLVCAQVQVGKTRRLGPKSPTPPNFAAIEVWAPNGRAGQLGQGHPRPPAHPICSWTDGFGALLLQGGLLLRTCALPAPPPARAPTLECPPRTGENPGRGEHGPTLERPRGQAPAPRLAPQRATKPPNPIIRLHAAIPPNLLPAKLVVASRSCCCQPNDPPASLQPNLTARPHPSRMMRSAWLFDSAQPVCSTLPSFSRTACRQPAE